MGSWRRVLVKNKSENKGGLNHLMQGMRGLDEAGRVGRRAWRGDGVNKTVKGRALS